jgi:uncharacterized membrane protein YdbT with pleckstrin-like domain
MGKSVPDATLLWRDRKRILGLPISFTVYTLKNQRLYLKEGFFNTKENEMLLYRILDINLSRSLGDKIFGVGSLTLFTADETHREFVVKNIKNPQQVRDLISTEVEKERERLKIRGREIYGVSDSDGTDNVVEATVDPSE